MQEKEEHKMEGKEGVHDGERKQAQICTDTCMYSSTQ